MDFIDLPRSQKWMKFKCCPWVHSCAGFSLDFQRGSVIFPCVKVADQYNFLPFFRLPGMHLRKRTNCSVVFASRSCHTAIVSGIIATSARAMTRKFTFQVFSLSTDFISLANTTEDCNETYLLPCFFQNKCQSLPLVHDLSLNGQFFWLALVCIDITQTKARHYTN